MPRLNFSWSLTIPFVDDVHQAVLMFLRTSAAGIWEPNHEEKSDALVMHFRRGDWGRAWLSKRLVPKLRLKEPGRASTLLCVTVRPLPDELQVRLIYTVELPFFHDPPVMEKHKRSLENLLYREAQDFASYLTKFYSLKSGPTLIAS